MKFLSKGLFEKDFMQTKVKTYSMSFAERLFGYGLGPGFVLVYTTMVSSLREMFYMSVLPIDKLYGANSYMTLQTTASIIGVITGLIINYVTERTVSRAGRFRPYMLIGTILMAVTGVGMFYSPFESGSTAELVWLYVTNIIYLGIATILFNQRYNLLSVSSRNLKDRNFATTVSSTLASMIPGVFVALLVMGWLYYAFLANDTVGTYWRIFILIPAIIAIPAAILEYFFTRERITEENRKMNAGKEQTGASIPLLQQMKYLLTNKYYWIAMLLGFATTMSTYLQGTNSRTYFTQWILGANETNGIAMIYLMVSMQPMAIGAIVVPILTRKFGARKILRVSSVIVLLGLGIAVIQPSNFLFAVLGGLVFSCGMVAVMNMNSIFGQQAADMIEYEHGFRQEGTLAAGLIGAATSGLLSPFSALYETVLHNLGFDAYATVQNEAVNNWIIFAYYGSYAIWALAIFVATIFFDAEKKMPQVHAELKERRKAATLARGEEWFDEEEYERRKKEETERLSEENRIKDLKARCAKKGLDFDKENQKYLAKKAKKDAKKNRQNV